MFAFFFFVGALLLLIGTVIFHYIIRTKFQEKDSERKIFMLVFMTITVISFLQVVFLYTYTALRLSATIYQRYLIENFSNLVWDIPVILIMCYSHHISFYVPPEFRQQDTQETSSLNLDDKKVVYEEISEVILSEDPH